MTADNPALPGGPDIAATLIRALSPPAPGHSSRSDARLPAPSEPQGASSITSNGSGGPDPAGAASAKSEDELKAQRVVRELTFWYEGFSVDNGPLYRYDDPANVQLLQQINAGRAPPQVFNVRLGQLVEVHVSKRTNEHAESTADERLPRTPPGPPTRNQQQE